MELEGSFGDLVPYGDPAWYQRFNSPYYNESHRQWRAKVTRVCTFMLQLVMIVYT